MSKAPVFESVARGEWLMGGVVGERVTGNVRQWLLSAPDANPAMLQIFRDRDRTPARDLVPWAGEFAGKYLISAVQALSMSKEKGLKARVASFVAELIATQRADGYFGPFAAGENMIGPGRWDLWGQYHVLLGLLRYYQATGDKAALASCRRGADHFCYLFLDSGKRVVQAGSEEMNESSIHVFTLLFAETGEPRYLRLAHEIEKDWEAPGSGDYVRAAIAGKPFWATPKPRWESLHSVQAIAELYFLTGESKYRDAFERLWWSIVQGDRHNTGGFSSGEQATGNPYDPRPIETCCTVAWMAVTVDYLRMTGDARAADELELSTWNATLGAQHTSGRWWTYNTPMDGERKASAHDIVFQARAGSPELNCCSVNGPRSLGMLSEWAVMRAPGGIALNWYGPSAMSLTMENGVRLRLDMRTDFPESGAVKIVVNPSAPARFVLRLRIPGWSQKTGVAVNGERLAAPAPGSYLTLERLWKPGDTIDLSLDLRPWVWVGERDASGKVSLYHGPILLAYDPRFDVHDPTRLPALGDARSWNLEPIAATAPNGPAPLLRRRLVTASGARVTLCDFASAGASGNRYVSWLPASGLAPATFGRDNPWRMVRL